MRWRSSPRVMSELKSPPFASPLTRTPTSSSDSQPTKPAPQTPSLARRRICSSRVCSRRYSWHGCRIGHRLCGGRRGAHRREMAGRSQCRRKTAGSSGGAVPPESSAAHMRTFCGSQPALWSSKRELPMCQRQGAISCVVAPCVRASGHAPTISIMWLQALQRAQDDDGAVDDAMDQAGLGCAKGTGPRLFCGHVPKVGRCAPRSIAACARAGRHYRLLAVTAVTVVPPPLPTLPTLASPCTAPPPPHAPRRRR